MVKGNLNKIPSGRSSRKLFSFCVSVSLLLAYKNTLARILPQLCLLLKNPAPVVQISCCYMKVKFYDQKLKLGRKLVFVVVGRILLVVPLFIFLFSKAQPTTPARGAPGFLGDACSKQVLRWGKLSQGDGGRPPSATAVALEQGFRGCFRRGHLGGTADAFHWVEHGSWVSSLEQARDVSKVTV